jgi:diguanylate cyclase (GGDEF)-like protein/PAS domain S-box-containing protein
VDDPAINPNPAATAAPGEETFRALFSAAGQPIVVEQDGRLVDCNAAALELFRCSREELLATPPSRLHAEFQPDGWRSDARMREIVAAAMTGQAQIFEWQQRRADGSEFPAEVTLTIFEYAGQPYRLSLLRDLSAQKLAEQALRASEQRYRLLAEQSDDIIARIGADGRYLDVSPSVTRIAGFLPDELIGHPFTEFIHPDDVATVRAAHQRALNSAASGAVTYRAQHSHGHYLWFETTGKAVRSADNGEVVEIVCNSRDITLRMAVEDELHEAELATVIQESEERAQHRNTRHLHQLVEVTQGKLWETDATGRSVYVSPSVRQLLGYTPEEILGKTPFELMPAEEAKRVAAITLPLIEARKPIRLVENINLAKDGRQVVLETSAVPLFDPGGNFRGYHGIDRDITERIEAHKMLGLAKHILEQLPEGVLITDADNRIISVNAAFTRNTGYSADEVLGQSPRVLASGRHDAAFYQAMWRELVASGQWQGEVWNRRKNGDIYLEWVRVTAIRDAQGQVSNYVGIYADVVTQEHVRKRLHNLAYYDPLTELPNRELFQDRLATAMAHARREGTHIALLFFDLDRFKGINDSLGHQVGDGLLRGVAERLHTVVRESDTIARLGGDEFTLILSDITDPSEAGAIAQKVLDVFTTPFLVERHELSITASIGIALFPDDGQTAECLVKSADIAMYRAKEVGRNGYEFYDAQMSSRFAERLALEHDLRHAIEGDQFMLYYQPQLALQQQRVIGMEAVLRWNHPDRGLLLPEQFMPTAEESGLILPLGNWALRAACRQARRWIDAGFADFRIAVNVSAAQLRSLGFVDAVTETLQQMECSPQCLELELTERALLDNQAQLTVILEQLAGLGIGIVIDNFGTGFSSISHLAHLPIDKVKIDPSFVADAPNDPAAEAITAAIIAMGRHLGFQVIAEGVETGAQLDLLQRLACNTAQGSLLSAAASADEAQQFWSTHR